MEKHSEVRYINPSDYDVNSSEYMVLYSFITSHGWRRIMEEVDGKKYPFWVSKDGKRKVQDIEDAAAIQRSIVRSKVWNSTESS